MKWQTAKFLFRRFGKLSRAESCGEFPHSTSRLSDLEDMLSKTAANSYNESVNMYNIGIHEMPTLLFARPMGYTDKPLLHISEEEKKYDGIRF